jgi:hypothetical protein
MSLLKPIHKTSVLIPYEQLFIQTFHHNGNLFTSHLILIHKSQPDAQVTEFILSYIGQTSRNLNTRYREHIRYIRNNEPQSDYAKHILQHLHKYESITDNMSLLKPKHKTSLLISYEQLFIQTFHHNGNLFSEQGTGEQNPLFQLAIDTMLTSATT